jgi:hypothetical protein
MTADRVPEFTGLFQCASCFQVDQWKLRRLGEGIGCPLIVQAAAGKPPSQWKRDRCADYLKRPPVFRVAKERPLPQEPLFDEPTPEDRRLVEVSGWPDYRARGLVPGRSTNKPPGAA